MEGQASDEDGVYPTGLCPGLDFKTPGHPTRVVIPIHVLDTNDRDAHGQGTGTERGTTGYRV